jgi:peptide deformylase
MAIRQLRYSGDGILKMASREVVKIDGHIREILDDMVDTMYDACGIGLAAVQVGVLRRLVVLDIGDGPVRLINPEITQQEGQEESVEACLSVPGWQGTVSRPQKITVKYTDENGDSQSVEAEGQLKRVLCHEIDHLFGILYSDIASSLYEVHDSDGEAAEEEAPESPEEAASPEGAGEAAPGHAGQGV